ncbi:MAG: SDR family oxidoreductase, partial [Nitrospinota bacterium]
MTDYFITGVSSGIGQGLARELARRGHRIWGVARREKRLAELARELGADRFLFSVCDVSRSEDVRATTREMERAGFLPEVVILNAGINPEQWG